jgi:hypothetical protein
VTALSSLSECYALVTDQGEPVYHASHDMIPPEAVTRLMGYLLSAISGVMAISDILMLIPIALGVRGALYIASFIAMCWIWVLVKSGPAPRWENAVVLSSSVLVLCSAGVHWVHSHQRAKQK